MKERRIEQVLEAHKVSLLALPGVVGVAQGVYDGAPCIRVFIARAAASTHAPIPLRIEDFPVRVDLIDPYRARSDRAAG